MAFNINDIELGKLDRVELENLVEKLAKENAELEEKLAAQEGSAPAGGLSSLGDVAKWTTDYFAVAEATAQMFLDETKQRAEAQSAEILGKASLTAAEVERQRKDLDEKTAQIKTAANKLMGQAQIAANDLLKEAEVKSNEMIADAQAETDTLRAQAQELYAKTKELCEQMIEKVKSQIG